MSCRVLIRRCIDPHRARIIANEIARWAGSDPETIYGIITVKTVCIRKKASDNDALRLKAQYGALGAEVDLVPIDGGALPVAASHSSARSDADEEENEAPVAPLNDAEYAQRIRQRSDIFYLEGNRRLTCTESVSLVCAIIICILLSAREAVQVVSPDFFDPAVKTIATLIPHQVDRPTEIRNEEKQEPVEQFTERKSPRPNTATGKGGTSGGGGNPYERVTKAGVLGILSGQIKGKTIASADLFGKGGYASEIDAILQGLNGLKTGGGGGVGRKGESGIGYGVGYKNGFGGESGLGGIENLIGNSSADLAAFLKPKTRGTPRIVLPDFAKGEAFIGGRSKLSISRVVMQNIAALRHAYNKRLREKPGLKGKIIIKFAIDEFGNVIFCKLEESTLSDENLEVAVVDKIKFWKFEKIDKPGDVTEVVYPFVFSQ